jgi:hypothetical protein
MYPYPVLEGRRLPCSPLSSVKRSVPPPVQELLHISIYRRRCSRNVLSWFSLSVFTLGYIDIFTHDEEPLTVASLLTVEYVMGCVRVWAIDPGPAALVMMFASLVGYSGFISFLLILLGAWTGIGAYLIVPVCIEKGIEKSAGSAAGTAGAAGAAAGATGAAAAGALAVEVDVVSVSSSSAAAAAAAFAAPPTAAASLVAAAAAAPAPAAFAARVVGVSSAAAPAPAAAFAA